jgi:two-component system response regulator RegX3
MAYRLLLVTRDKDWGQAAVSAAQAGDLACATVEDGAGAIKTILESGADVSLVDLDAPGLGGLSWLEVLRQTDEGRGAAVILASRRKSDDDVAAAFELGADDYVLKSVDPVELLARTRAVLRRHFERAATWGGPELRIGQVILDPARHRCWVRKNLVELNPREFELLEILMRKAGRVLSRPYLLETLWGMSRQANTRSVDVAVSRLRKALGPRAGKWVETVERYGYRFRDPAQLAR